MLVLEELLDLLRPHDERFRQDARPAVAFWPSEPLGRVVEEEADESLYWMELLHEGCDVNQLALTQLYSEGNEIVAMTVASIKTRRTLP